MRQTDLKYPYPWCERKPAIHEGVLFVPDYYHAHKEFAFPQWDAIFGKELPVVIEYCSGNGGWIIDRARRFPEMGWVAVEWRFERVRKIWAKMKNLSIPNLFIVCGEALTFTENYLSDQCIDGIYMNFPDPWPKEKHAKHRLVQLPFVAQAARIAKSNAEAIFVTDHPAYRDQIIREMLQEESWSSRFAKPHFVLDWHEYGTSYFERLWRDKGLPIHYMAFTKR